MRLASEIVKLATKANVKITSAESCTGGMISAALTDVVGSSVIFEQGFVTYSNLAKINMLLVSKLTLQQYGAVSEPVAAEMATGALNAARADIAVSVSGIAGPGGSESKPEGRVCFCLTSKHVTQSKTVEFGPLGRQNVRKAATVHALELIFALLKTAY